jgi:hypothetical protein
MPSAVPAVSPWLARLVALCLLCVACLPLALPAQAHPRGDACVPVHVEAARRTLRAADGSCIRYLRTPPPATTAGGLEVLVLGDVQVKHERDLHHFRRDIVQPLLGRHGAALGLQLGDVVDDVPALLQPVKRTAESLGIPWLFAPGNHDIDHMAAADADALHAFRTVFGAETRGWETPLANIVMLDSVISLPGQRPAYIGGLREDQFAFLQAWLPTLRKDRLLVLGMHIPLFEEAGRDSFRDADRARLFALLRDFPHVLVLSAHSHTQRHVLHDAASGWHGATPLHEFNVGAACGSYWAGAPDAEGIPASTMADGTPNGYARLTVRPGGAYGLSWHPARDPDTQIGLHAPKVLRRGAYPAWGVFANVYMGMDDTRVEFRVDGGEWMPMRKVLQPDPAMTLENALDDTTEVLRGFDRSPEAVVSTHLWRGALPTRLAAGEHEVEVRAFDRWRGEVRASTTYRLLDP